MVIIKRLSTASASLYKVGRDLKEAGPAIVVMSGLKALAHLRAIKRQIRGIANLSN